MSFVKKAVKKIFKFGKKLIKKTGKFLKRAWKNKWVRAALMVALTVFTAGIAAGGFSAFAGVNSVGGFFSAVGTTMANGFTAIGNFFAGKGFGLGAAAEGTATATTTAAATDAAVAAGGTTAAEAGAALQTTAAATEAAAGGAAAGGGGSSLLSAAELGAGSAEAAAAAGSVAITPVAPIASIEAGVAAGEVAITGATWTSRVVAAIKSPLKSLFIAKEGGLSLGGYLALSGALGAWQQEQARKDAWDDYYKRLSMTTVWGGGAWGETEFDLDSVIRPPRREDEVGTESQPEYMAQTGQEALLSGGKNTEYNQGHSAGVLQSPTPITNMATLQKGLMG